MVSASKEVYGRIYLVQNLVNGKKYVGLTTGSIAARWKSHCKSDNGCSALANAIAKHGANSFSISELDVAYTHAQLNEMERQYVLLHQSLVPNGYNIKEGGGSAGRWSPYLAEKMQAAFARPGVRAKMRANIISRWKDPAERARLSAAIKVGLADPAVREKRSRIAKERSLDPAVQGRASISQKKRFSDPAERQRVGDAARLRLQDPAYRKRVNDAATAVKQTEEFRTSASEKMKALWRNPEYADRIRASRREAAERRKSALSKDPQALSR